MLKAAPHPNLYILNGLNVGVGGRTVHPSLIGIDAHRGMPEGSESELAERLVLPLALHACRYVMSPATTQATLLPSHHSSHAPARPTCMPLESLGMPTVRPRSGG